MSGSRRGGQSASTGEDAKYMSEEAVGWDECFPTVGPWDASATAWRRRLRDHGDLWGRPWRVEMAGVDMLALSFASTQFHFARSLHLDGGTLIARYSVTNLDREPLPMPYWRSSPTTRSSWLASTKSGRAPLSLGGRRLPVGELSWSGRSDMPALHPR